MDYIAHLAPDNERLTKSKWYFDRQSQKSWTRERTSRCIDIVAEGFDIELTHDEKAYLKRLLDRDVIFDDHGWVESTYLDEPKYIGLPPQGLQL
jgi:hypothetical protein